METLADLKKSVKKGRNPEDEVGFSADKFPEVHGVPCAYHVDLCIANLMGYCVPMTGQIPVSRGRPVRVAGKTGIVFEHPPEAEAFMRWQKREFLELERQFASLWRKQLDNTDLSTSVEWLRMIGLDRKPCKSLEEAKSLAESFVNSPEKRAEQIEMARLLLDGTPELYSEILKRWEAAGNVPLSQYAPYTAYVFTIELFFHLALKYGIIGTTRASNRVDIAYLFYLPFSMVFVSSDRLHRRCAPLFLRANQDFVWGYDLKEDLGRIDEHYRKLPDHIKELGLCAFASYPPLGSESLVTRLWSRHMRKREKTSGEGQPFYPKEDPEVINKINQFAEAPSLKPEEIDFNLSNPDAVLSKKLVRKRKGSWWQLPKNL